MPDELRPWHEAADGLTGRTLLRRAAVTAAVERDLAGVPGVHRASATLDGAVDDPALRVTVELADRADPARARLGVRDAVARFEATTGLVPRALDVTPRVAGPAAAETVTETWARRYRRF